MGRLRNQSNQSHIMKSCNHKAKCSMNEDEDNDKRDYQGNKNVFCKILFILDELKKISPNIMLTTSIMNASEIISQNTV